MDWKAKFDKANDKMHKAGDRIKDDAKQKLDSKIDLAKNKASNSALGRFAKEKGFKNKAKFLGKGALNKLKGTEAARKIQNAIKNIVKVVQFIAANIAPIGITLAVLVIGSNLAIMIVGVSQSIGETPHYYCKLNPSPSVRDSKEYNQYCKDASNYTNLTAINGHYIVQDGAGPCTSCSVLNMLLRFYDISDVNLYNYLWQSNGQYPPNAENFIAESPDMYNMRRFMNRGTSSCNTDPWRAKIPNVGSKDFAYLFGKENYTMANWGYLRDPTIGDSSEDEDSEDGDISESSESSGSSESSTGLAGGGYDDLTTNENWVWDLSLDNDAPGSNWNCAWDNGRQLTVEGTTATFVHVEGGFRSVNELKILLDAHPAGITIYRNYGHGNHAILITGYKADTDTFMVVDPALGLMGGFEIDADSCVHGSGGVTIFNNDILKNPTTENGIISYTYIEEG